MPIREANYTASAGVKSVLSEDIIESLVKRVVDKAYDRNMDLSDQTFSNRFVVPIIDGKVATGGLLLAAIEKNPSAISKLIVIVSVFEEKGKDEVYIATQPEIEKAIADKKATAGDGLLKLLRTPARFPWEH